MNLLLVNSARPGLWGGGEKWFVEAAAWLRGRGHEATLVGRPDSRLLRAAQDKKIPCIEFSFGGDFDPLAATRARGILRTLSPQAVLVNFNKEARQFGRAARKLRIPVAARHGFPLLRNRIHHRRLYGSYITKLIVNSSTILERYRESGFDITNAEVIFNGVTPQPQKPGALRTMFSIEKNAPLIAAAGRLESQKRLDRVIHTAAELAPDFPAARFLIIGDGPLKSTLEEQIARRNLRERVILTGFLPDFASLVGDADLFLLTSDEEGAPNVLLEAMAAGTACIAFAVGSVPDILKGLPPENLIAPGDTPAMTVQMRKLLSDSDLLHRTAEQMQRHVLTNFSFDQSMTRYETVLRELTESS